MKIWSKADVLRASLEIVRESIIQVVGRTPARGVGWPKRGYTRQLSVAMQTRVSEMLCQSHCVQPLLLSSHTIHVSLVLL